MLTKLTIRNFKRFEEVDIELGNPVVLSGWVEALPRSGPG